MFYKIAFKNASRSIKEYGIYFLTLVFGVCIFYMFNSIHAQKEIMIVTKTQNEAMQSLSMILSYISVFVSVILGFLIVYANGFFIKRRKKEIGLYLTLGMEKNHISMILMLETLVLALMALIVGLFSGVFLSQAMSVFTAKIFEVDMSAYKFVFSPSAAIKSIIYFSFIFIIVMLFNTISISRFQLIDLIHGGKKNQTLIVKNRALSVLIFIISLISIALAYVIILKNGIINMNIMFLLSIILGSIGTTLFFFSLTGILIRIVQRNKKFYYKNLNMFIMRQIGSKINTNFISMAVVCIILLLTIGTLSTGIGMANVLSESLRDTIPFDVSFIDLNSSGESEDSHSILDNLNELISLDDTIENASEYSILYDTDIKYADVFDIEELEGFEGLLDNPLKFISLSDYNEVLKNQDIEPLNLEKGFYAISSGYENLNPILEQMIVENKGIKIGGEALYPYKQFLEIPLSNNHQYDLTFIVNDEAVSLMEVNETIANINYKSEESGIIFEEAIKSARTKNAELGFTYFLTKSQLYSSSITTKALVTFLSIYLGFVFLITCAAVLALQQLSEAIDNKERYDLLHKLGADKKILIKALFTQIAVYFLLPLGLAVVHSIVGITAVHDVIKSIGKMNILSNIFMTASFVVVVYGAYFIATFIGSKRIINR